MQKTGAKSFLGLGKGQEEGWKNDTGREKSFLNLLATAAVFEGAQKKELGRKKSKQNWNPRRPNANGWEPKQRGGFLPSGGQWSWEKESRDRARIKKKGFRRKEGHNQGHRQRIVKVQ